MSRRVALPGADELFRRTQSPARPDTVTPTGTPSEPLVAFAWIASGLHRNRKQPQLQQYGNERCNA